MTHRRSPAVDTAAASSSGASETAVARAALSDLSNRANLDDAQVAVINTAQKALAAGNAARAARLAGHLDRDVRNAIQGYTVSKGETLWQIAAKPEVYGNGYLWPLIWDANRTALSDPSRLPENLELKIRPYPTLAETAAALDYSHKHGLTGAANGS